MSRRSVGFSSVTVLSRAYSLFIVMTVGILILSCLVSVEFAYAAEDFWVSKAPVPVAGIDGVEALNGKIYAILSSNNAVYEYDPMADNWTLRTHVPTFRNLFAVAACEGKLYVIGGRIGSEPMHGDSISCAVTEAYDPIKDTWETKASMPTARTQMQAETVDGKIYVMGGRTAGPYSTVNITEVYNSATDTWTRKATMIYPVASFASATLDDKIYAIGGQDEYHPYLNLDTTQIYDTTTDNWTLGKKAPMVIWQAAAGATTGLAAPKRIYVAGGCIGFAQGTNQTYAYDPETDIWTSAAAMPIDRYNPNAAVVNDLMYVIGGGQDINSLSVNQQYTPIGYQEPPAPMLTPTLTPSSSPTVIPTSPSPSTTISSITPSPIGSPTASLTQTPPNSTEIALAIEIIYLLAAIAVIAFAGITLFALKRHRN